MGVEEGKKETELKLPLAAIEPILGKLMLWSRTQRMSWSMKWEVRAQASFIQPSTDMSTRDTLPRNVNEVKPSKKLRTAVALSEARGQRDAYSTQR